MILVGNQRGGATNLARHLMKVENERVEVHQVRGFASNDLQSAFRESYAMSRATKCKQHLFSLSLNPPKDAKLSPEEFEKTVDRAEEQLGLNGQPRAIVLHTKNGRTHAHAVWSRIKTDEMRAVQMSFSKRRMQDLSRELYREHGWQMPRGFVRHEERDPRNFSLAEWQQCKRAKRDPAKTKEIFQDAWMVSQLSKQAECQRLRYASEQSLLSERQAQERSERDEVQQARLRKGVLGLVDRLTGKRKRTIEQNHQEKLHAEQQANAERQSLTKGLQTKQSTLQAQSREAALRAAYIRRELAKDAQQLKERYVEQRNNGPDIRPDKQIRRASSRRRRDHDGPSWEP